MSLRRWALSLAMGLAGIEAIEHRPRALRNGPESDQRQRSNTLGDGAVEAKIPAINFLRHEEQMKDPIITYLENKIAQIESSRYGEEERATPGLLAWLHRQVEERKVKAIQ